jgi:arylformamidase
MQGYRGLSSARLEAEMSPSSMFGGAIDAYLEAYAERSANARRKLACRENISYGDAPSELLDFFPASEAGAPLFIFVHGGYWQELSHKDGAPMAAEMIAMGYAFAALDYTLAPKGTIEQMIAEVGRAISFLQSNAVELCFDPSRITLSGHSAGAHLAAMQIMRHPPASGIEHLLLLSGVYDLEPVALTSINDPLGLDIDRARALSPMFLKPLAHPRVTVAVADGDTREFRWQSEEFAAHLTRFGCRTTFLTVPGRNHFDIILDLSFARDDLRPRG